MASNLVIVPMYGVILLLPAFLLLLGFKVKSATSTPSGDPEPQELSLARWLSWVAACIPATQFLLSALPARSLGNSPGYLWLGLPLLAVCAGLVAAVLFLLNARGLERFTSSAASLLALIFALIAFFGGMVTA